MRDLPKDKSGLSTQYSLLSTGDSALSTGKLRGLAYWDTPRTFTRWQKIQIAIFSRLAAVLIGSIGRTLRWESEGDEHLEQVYKNGKRAILTFWHCCTFASAYYFRRQGIVVMSSQNFDSELLAGGLVRL